MLNRLNIDGVDNSYNQGAACFSADKNFIYFTQWKKEKRKKYFIHLFGSEKWKLMEQTGITFFRE